MKKKINKRLGLALGAALLGMASCSAVDLDSDARQSEKEFYNGLYLMFGAKFSGCQLKNRLRSNGVLSVKDLGLDLGALGVNAGQMTVDEMKDFVKESVRNLFYVQLREVNDLNGSGGVLEGFKGKLDILEKSRSAAKSNFGGTAAIGCGRFAGGGNCWIGLDASFDFSKSEKALDGKVGQNGFIPTVAAKLGRYFEGVGALAYLKAGVCSTSVKFEEQNPKRFVAPVVGFGFEKKVGSFVSVAIEADWRFKTSKTFEVEKSDNISRFIPGSGPNASTVVRAEQECKVGGWTVRLMLAARPKFCARS